MFKVSTKEERDGISLYVEGRLAGPWVSELERCWRAEREQTIGSSKTIYVCLSGVTFIDNAGKALLVLMFESGAKLEGKGCMTRAILAGIAGWRDEGAEKAADAEPRATREPRFGKHGDKSSNQ